MEVIVVDDCSTDDTVSVIEAISKPRVTVFRQEKNQGPAAARNRGLREAMGEYCTFLDGDDYWEPDFLKETMTFLDSHPEAIAVSVMQCHKIIGKEPSVVPQGTGMDSAVLLDDFFEFWWRYNHVCTGSVLFRRDVALRIGGQREDLRICEDLEFWAMLGRLGKWGFIPKVLFTSDGGAVTRKQGWREKMMIRWTNAPSFQEWRKRIDGVDGGATSPYLEQSLGKIARNLCYCHIMSKRDDLARNEVKAYGMNFPPNKINRFFKFMATNRLLWQAWCAFLRFREMRRKY